MKKTVFISVLVLLINSTAGAATILYENEADFLTALGSWQLESFEGVPVGDYSPQLSLNGITITAENIHIRDDYNEGGHPTHGNQYLAAATMDDNYKVTFTFDTPIQAFGINVIDFGDAGTGSLYFADDAGDEYTIKTVPPNLPNGNDFFFGILNTDQTFSEVTLWKTTVGEGAPYDELYFRPVPIPSALWILGSGLVGLAALRKRRKVNV